MKKKKFICILLCMLLLAVTGCGTEQRENVQSGDRGEAGEGMTDGTRPPTGIAGGAVSQERYVPEFVSLTAIEDMGNLLFLENKVYYTSYAYDEASHTGQDELWVMDLDTWECNRVELPLQDGEFLYDVCAYGEDGFALLLAHEGIGVRSYGLKIVDKDGLVTLEQDISQALAEDSQVMTSWLSAMETDWEGNIYFLFSGMNDRLVVLDDRGQVRCNISGTGTFKDLFRSGTGQVFIFQGDGMTGYYSLQEIDLPGEKLGAVYGGIAGAGEINVCYAALNESEFLISMGKVLYRYDLSTESSEEVLNWINCDIDPQRIRGFDQQEDGRILTFLGGASYEVATLTKKAGWDDEKIVLMLGTMGSIDNMRTQIIGFNRSNGKYRVEVREYGNDEAGRSRLNADIVSGNGLDIIDMSFIDANIYSGKGILADLYPLIDSDASFSREDFVESALNAYERDGKLYGIPLNFSVRTLLGKTSVVGEEMGWSIEDVLSLAAAYPEGTELVEYRAKADILEMLLRAGVGDYVDWEAGTCSFDSQEFTRLLELADRFPDAVTASAPGDNSYLKLKEGRLLLVQLDMYNVSEYLVNASIFEEPVTAIGYPSAEGSGTLLETGQGFGILEQSENKEGAWEFIRIFLDEEFQDRRSIGGFPVRESSLQKVFDAAQQENLEFSMGIEMEGFSYVQKPATDEEIARIRSIIDNAQSTVGFDRQLYNIILEEAEGYFAGQRTALDVVRVIQSKAAIYVSENS